jgi:hypothetical protein
LANAHRSEHHHYVAGASEGQGCERKKHSEGVRLVKLVMGIQDKKENAPNSDGPHPWKELTAELDLPASDVLGLFGYFGQISAVPAEQREHSRTIGVPHVQVEWAAMQRQQWVDL